MANQWENLVSCAVSCSRCDAGLGKGDPRILSVYDHQPICMDCKAAEERRDDYESASREMIGQCLIDTEIQYSDPGGYCYHHFYPYHCND